MCSREDLARVLAGVLDCVPSDGLAVTVSVTQFLRRRHVDVGYKSWG